MRGYDVARTLQGHGLPVETKVSLPVKIVDGLNAYLEKVPQYLSDLRYFSITFLGIVSPYPETPFFAHVAAEGRLLPGVISRDLDGYTLCHRPPRLKTTCLT